MANPDKQHRDVAGSMADGRWQVANLSFAGTIGCDFFQRRGPAFARSYGGASEESEERFGVDSSRAAEKQKNRRRSSGYKHVTPNGVSVWSGEWPDG